MELGITPIVTSSMAMQLLAGARLIDVNESLREDRLLFQGAQKLFGILITLGQAIAFVCMSDDVTGGRVSIFLIVVQLCCSGIVIIVMDELLQKGYGMGSGVSLFIAANICQSVVWQALSPSTMDAGHGAEFTGAILALFHSLFARTSKISALKDAFYRSNAPNLSSLFVTALVFLSVIYFQAFRVELNVKYQKIRGQQGHYPIKLFYTSNTPVILHTVLVSNYYFLSQLLYKCFQNNIFINLLGRWEGTAGVSVPVGGLAYYISPPQTFLSIFTEPCHSLFYIVFVITSCALFSKAWLDVSGLSARAVARNLRDQQMAMKGFRDTSLVTVLNRYIPTAATFGGICIGAMTVVADFLGVFGSGTGILLAVTIIYEYYEMFAREGAEQR